MSIIHSTSRQVISSLQQSMEGKLWCWHYLNLYQSNESWIKKQLTISTPKVFDQRTVTKTKADDKRKEMCKSKSPLSESNKGPSDDNRTITVRRSKPTELRRDWWGKVRFNIIYSLWLLLTWSPRSITHSQHQTKAIIVTILRIPQLPILLLSNFTSMFSLWKGIMVSRSEIHPKRAHDILLMS
jgi:hypothetical protein